MEEVYKINNRSFRRIPSKDGDRIKCVKEDVPEGKITKYGDVGTLDLHYDRVYMDNGEHYIYTTDAFATLVRFYTNDEMKEKYM